MKPAGHAAVTEDGAVKSGPGELVSVLLTAGDGAAASLVLYDNTAASGTVLCTVKAATGTSQPWAPTAPYVFANGCYADIGGSGAAAYVVYI